MNQIVANVLGVTSGCPPKVGKEIWWWTEKVQQAVQKKKDRKKIRDQTQTEEAAKEFKEASKRARKEVAIARHEAYQDLYDKLDSQERQNMAIRIAKMKDRDSKDIRQAKLIKEGNGQTLTHDEKIRERWRKYFQKLLNEDNQREQRAEETPENAGTVEEITKDKVRTALRRMKNGKAVGPDGIPVEAWKCLEEEGVEWLAKISNNVLKTGLMPNEWRESIIVPVYKNKGDVQECGNYRGIKLTSHTLKTWEQLIDTRLRAMIEI